MGVLVRNVSNAEDLDGLQVPTKADGSFYRFEMVADGGWHRYYDDEPAALVAFLIPGYLDLNEEDRLAARIRHAVDLQVRLQARLNTFFSNAPRTNEEHSILTGPRHKQPDIDTWGCEVPLVLVDAFYGPYTDAPTPISLLSDVAFPPNLWWLRPAEGDMEYLRSLHETSLIDLHMTADEVI